MKDTYFTSADSWLKAKLLRSFDFWIMEADKDPQRALHQLERRVSAMAQISHRIYDDERSDSLRRETCGYAYLIYKKIGKTYMYDEKMISSQFRIQLSDRRYRW